MSYQKITCKRHRQDDPVDTYNLEEGQPGIGLTGIVDWRQLHNASDYSDGQINPVSFTDMKMSRICKET